MEDETGSNDVCGSEDLQWIAPVTGNSVYGTIPFSWSYLNADCTKTGNVQLFTLQLWDHNQQWIPLTTVSSLATGTTFDSLLLSGVKNIS